MCPFADHGIDEWSIEDIESLRKAFQEGKLIGGYGLSTVQKMSDHIDEHLRNNVM